MKQSKLNCFRELNNDELIIIIGKNDSTEFHALHYLHLKHF